MKNSTFFAESEDLVYILKNNINKINEKSIKKISTGWTNIVVEFQAGDVSYIARFPRNDFFAKQIEIDVFANNFLKDIVGIKTVDMKIFYNKNRPFSIHKKIPGSALTERIDILSEEKKNKITKEIAEFYFLLHNFPKSKIPDILQRKLSDFLIQLSKVDDNYYDYSSLLDLKSEEEKETVLVHGDLNIGNIILNKNDEIVAFIDFAFCGLSDRYLDLSRISCRVNEDFLNKIISNYEIISGLNIDREKLKKRNSMWSYIEEQYIVYMKNYHPEIVLPEGC